MNLADIFFERANKQPVHPAIFLPGKNSTISYFDLKNTIDALAEKLQSAGLKSGDTIGLAVPSGLDYIVLTYATWKLRGIAVPIPMELALPEKLQICHDIHIDHIISTRRSSKVFDTIRSGSTSALDPSHDFFSIIPRREHPPQIKEINAAFIRFTSGTTGQAKGVVLSHETIFDRIHSANDFLNLGPEDRIIWLLSMSYHFAVSIVAYLSFGSSIILCPSHFGAEISTITRDLGGTLIYGSPFHFDLIARDSASVSMPSLRLAISTTTALPQTTVDAFYSRFGIGLSQALGIIEIGLPCINVHNPSGKPQSVGRVLPSYTLFLDHTGLDNELGAIKFKGKGIFDAYYEPWRPRAEVMKDGWFATGDVGKLDQEGFLFISGRTKEVINVAGMKFFPQDVEKVLLTHPSVNEAKVYSIRENSSDIPQAEVVLKTETSATEEELQDFCRKSLADYKIPRKILMVDSIKKTASGKISRA